ncbi:MAG: carbon-nitrogen hydrolase family protein [Planctomycetes bacterium]|nr:carbon-nitrogen hydrolase family protein [Planctomycetota bacterium]
MERFSTHRRIAVSTAGALLCASCIAAAAAADIRGIDLDAAAGRRLSANLGGNKAAAAAASGSRAGDLREGAGDRLCRLSGSEATDAASRQRRFRRIRASVVTLPWSDQGRSLATVLDRLDEAGEAALSDIVCLPMECVKTDGEPIPGPISCAIAKKAKQHGMYVIGNIREIDGGRTYVTSFLCDREGSIAGTYRKSHKMPDEDIDLGDDLPVFDTDIGKIALRIGSDRHFPDIDHVFSVKGARMIFWSQMPEPVEDEHLQDFPSAGRASDYNVFIACARYSRAEAGWITNMFPPYRGCPIGRSYIINREGQRIASTTRKGSVATAVIPAEELRGAGRGLHDWPAFTALAEAAPILEKRDWAKRKVRVTVIENHRSIDDLCARLDESAEIGTDIACTYEFVWIPISGEKPSPERTAELEREAAARRARVAEKARQWNMYVLLCGVIERREVNEAILYGRDGREIGRYRKIATTYPEQIPGRGTPILETDFGRIGVKICADQSMVEIDRCYGLKGADIIFFSTQDWGPDAIWRELRDVSRAMDTQTFHVQATHSSSEALHRSIVIDPCGAAVSRSRYLAPGIASAVIDLDNDRPRRYVRRFHPHEPRGYLPEYQSTEVPEVRNDLRETVLAQRRPELYKALAVRPDVSRGSTGAGDGGSAGAAEPAGDIAIESPRIRLVLGSDGTCRGLIDTSTGRDWCFAQSGLRVIEGTVGGQADRAGSLSFDGWRLTARLEKHATELAYRVATQPDWILFELESVKGPRPDSLTLFRLPVAMAESAGAHLNLAREDGVAACILSARIQSYGRATPRGKWTDLRVVTQDAPGPRLEGAAAALILSPAAEIRGIIHRAATAFGLPTNASGGVPSKELPAAKRSYWFMGFGERDAGRMIEYCERSGIRQVMLNFHSWSTGPGHYPINTRNYPGGLESLKAVIGRLHDAGILIGMHTYASKVKKTDPYVTPVPDKRFWKELEVPLAEGVSPEQTEIRAGGSLAEWPGSPVAKRTSWEGGVAKHREVVIGDEIIRYAAIGPEGRYDTFLACERGAWKTRAASHDAGEAAYHYGVDGCIDGYIIDQETPLLDEVTGRLAEIFNACGFDMVYFDGGEDVDTRRFDYYVTKHQAAAMSKFTKRPIVHMGTVMTHGLWHSFTRAGTADTYMNTMRGRMIAQDGAGNARRVTEIAGGVVRRTVEYEVRGKLERWPTVKEHIDVSVRRAVAMEAALMPAELGWFGIWPENDYSDGLQLDEFEYLMVKSLAYDQPISLQTSFAQMEKHPLTAQILEMARTYEEMRLAGPPLDAATRERLRSLGRDFILVQTGGAREFAEVREVPDVAGTGDRLRAFAGAWGGGSVATAWHVARSGKLTLDIGPGDVSARTFAGAPVEVENAGGKAAIAIGSGRTTIFADSATPERLFRLLETARFEE